MVSSNIDVLPRLINAARAAIDRGDMYVGQEEEYPGASTWATFMDIPIMITQGRILLRLKVPRLAVSPSGEVVRIVSVHDGLYYTGKGTTYTINQLAWLEDKKV